MDNDYLRLIALCLSDGGVGFSKGALYIHFTNKSEILLNLFKEEVKKFTSNKIHQDKKLRGITLKVFDQDLIKKLLDISPSYRTRSCTKYPICPILKGNFNYKIGYHQHFNYYNLKYAEILIPESIFRNKEDKANFLQIYISCDGYASIFPRKKSWSAVERIIAIVCHHPKLKQRLHELLFDLKIKHSIKPYSLEMRSRESIISFKKKIGFIKGVKMTGNSKYWQGFSKDYVLDLILKSYSIKFESRNSDYILKKLMDSKN